MDAVTAPSGSGPGYLSIIIEALMYAGLKVGLPRDLALYSSEQAVLGTRNLILETKKNPAEIKDMVTTHLAEPQLKQSTNWKEVR